MPVFAVSVRPGGDPLHRAAAGAFLGFDVQFLACLHREVLLAGDSGYGVAGGMPGEDRARRCQANRCPDGSHRRDHGSWAERRALAPTRVRRLARCDRCTRALTNEDDTAVLLRSGFFEAANPEWLADPHYQGFLRPLSAYPLDRPVIVLPYEVNPETAPYLNKTLAPLTSRRRIVLIARFGGNTQTWLAAHFDTLGFAANSSQPPRGRLGPGL